MADQSDVRDALLLLIAGVILPNGGSVATSGQSVRMEVGWPDADLLAGLSQPGATVTAVVSVFPDPGMSRNTTRYNSAGQFIDAGGPASTMTVSVADPVVTFAGVPAMGQAVGIGIGRPLVPHWYRVPAGASLASVATAVAALIVGATSSGASVTLPATPISANVLMDGQAVAEPLEQEDRFHCCVWTADSGDRDTLAAAVQQALAPLTFLMLPDGTANRIKYERRTSSDKSARDLVYSADLLFSVEYRMTIFQTLARALFINSELGTTTTTIGVPAV